MEETTKPEEAAQAEAQPESAQPAAEESTQPAEQPTQESAQPAEGEAKPAEGEAKPAEGEAKPAEGEAKPAEATPEGVMKLGGGIELDGFSGIEKAHLVVVKKVVGNCAKEMTEKAKKFEKLSVSMSKEGDSISIHAELTDEGNQITADTTNSNLFMGLNKVLKEIIDKL